MAEPVFSFFDPGSRRLGWASGDGLSLPTADAWRFDQCGDDYGRMLDLIDCKLNAHIDQHKPELIGYEAPIKTPHDKLPALRKTLSIGTHIEFVALRRGIECGEIGFHEVKQALAGFSGATKDDMVHAAEKLGVALPATLADGREDAADSVGGWLRMIYLRNRKLSSRFDRILYSARGALL